ncbi:hypothetical protein LCGC14_1833020 [marine sediment metagenome]|uniref:Uncharacterized protein n=1 Tax=marine sediment metagenome TaxID=412755 RepID=A0A0F9H3K7_9ZZZZ
MECLHCGDCCLRMSPISQPNPCPHIIRKGSFYFCNRYPDRPRQCANHNFDSRFCPVGLGKLKSKFHNIKDIAQRIDKGYEMINTLNSE